MDYRDIDPELREKILKLGGASLLLALAVGWIIWISLPKEMSIPTLPKEEVTEAQIQSAAMRAITALNVSKKPLTSIAEIAPDEQGKPGTKDAWGNEMVLTMAPIPKSQDLTISIISSGPDENPSTADDITLNGLIEYIPGYKEYSLQSSELKRGG